MLIFLTYKLALFFQNSTYDIPHPKCEAPNWLCFFKQGIATENTGATEKPDHLLCIIYYFLFIYINVVIRFICMGHR